MGGKSPGTACSSSYPARTPAPRGRAAHRRRSTCDALSSFLPLWWTDECRASNLGWGLRAVKTQTRDCQCARTGLCHPLSAAAQERAKEALRRMKPHLSWDGNGRNNAIKPPWGRQNEKSHPGGGFFHSVVSPAIRTTGFASLAAH